MNMTLEFINKLMRSTNC